MLFVKEKMPDNAISYMPAACDCMLTRMGREIGILPCAKHENEILELLAINESE